MRSIVAAVAFLCVLFSGPAEARRHHGGRLPWCGIYMNQYFGKNDRSLWVARNWAREGSNAGGPAVGVVVVWPHHVGVIVGQDANGEWIVHSGNDGNAVRTRPRSLRGVIAYRSIGGGSSAYANLKGQEETARRSDKHLVALAVEGGHETNVRVPLKQSRARAHVAPNVPSYASPFTLPTELTGEVGTKKRKPVMQRERVLVGFLTPVPDPITTHVGKVERVKPSHGAPRTRFAQRAVAHPSSQASLQWGWNTPPDTGWQDTSGYGHAAGVVSAKHASRYRAR
jgi:hypothetical protein